MLSAHRFALARQSAALLLLAGCAARRSTEVADAWRTTSAGTFEIAYTSADANLAPSILTTATNTPETIQAFFQEPMDRGYHIRLFPDGASLGDYWRSIWNQPGFQRQCWMVAAAGAEEIQILSPRAWPRDACGRAANDAEYLAGVVRHEAVHVFHRRVNPQPAFLNQETVSWFVEGLATYASGQLSTADLNAVRAQVLGGYAPGSLQEVLSGRLNYAGAAALVRYLDERYGRSVIRAMTRETSVAAILLRTGRSETELLADWLASIRA